jgi:hypothetical protein
VVPPGYKLSGISPNIVIVECANNPQGEYSPEWRKIPQALLNTNSIFTCKACGTDIKAEAVEPLNRFTVDTTTGDVTPSVIYVKRTSASCCKQTTRLFLLAG